MGQIDAVLMIGFGGPNGPADVLPFLRNVTRGMNVPEARLVAVARHYEPFGGVSPLTRMTFQQRAGLEDRLAAAGVELPVYVGMRNWHPFLVDTLTEMAEAGIRRAVGFIAAPQHCYAGCGRYREDVLRARAALARQQLPDVEVVYVDSWFDHPLFVDAVTERIQSALHELDAAARQRAKLVFTAHSIPVTMAEESCYQQQLRFLAEKVAHRLGHDWTLVYQSRSGRPTDPWLEPDVKDYLREAAETGLDTVVLCPISFICDHVEVLYDLDLEAMAVCRELKLNAVRAETVNDHPRFLDMISDIVLRSIQRYKAMPPLPITSAGLSITPADPEK